MVLFKTTGFSYGHSYIFMQMSVSACGTQSMRFLSHIAICVITTTTIRAHNFPLGMKKLMCYYC